MRQIYLAILVLIITLHIAIAEEGYLLNGTIISIKEDFLLKLDGSIEVTSEIFETYIPIEDDAVIVFESNIAQIKEFTNLKIYDLSQSPIKEYIQVADVLVRINNTSCAGKYSIKDNVIKICSPLNEDNQLHFIKQYTLLPDTKCKEDQKRQQSFSYQYPSQDEPYALEYTTRADEGLKYLSPINCPVGPFIWEKFDIENGLRCKVEKLKFPDNIDKSLYLTLNMSITGEREDIIIQQENRSEKIKNIVIEVITIIFVFLAIIDYNWKGYIKKFFNRSLKNKIISIVIFIIYIILYIIFRWW